MYLQLEKRNSQVRVGSNGSRNWRVMGRHKPVMSRVATNVLAKGPGASLTEREKMATMARKRYCASYIDHEWDRSERRVSEGEKEVSSEAMDDVGDWRPRIRDFVALHFLRTRWGIRLGKAERPGMVVRASMSEAAVLSRKAR
jgi:DNA-directed RNA polymerase subunit N (RpoN/RPB10)